MVVPAAGGVQLTADQLSKLNSELSMVEGNCRVFGDMLAEFLKDTANQDADDVQLLRVCIFVSFIFMRA